MTFYRPERFLKNDPDYAKIHPFIFLPFGHGPRMCIGRRFAELEIQLGITKLLQNFRVESDNDIEPIAKMINVPDKPLRFKFTDL